MLELIVGVLLAAGATYYVLLPILRPPPEPSADTGVSDEGEDPDDDMSPRAVAFRALKEIEFDRATGKLSDQDYDALKAKYTGEALVAMRGEQGAGSREQKQTFKPAPRSPLPAPSCSEHGTPSEADAVFCPQCGKRLGRAAGYCAR